MSRLNAGLVAALVLTVLVGCSQAIDLRTGRAIPLASETNTVLLAGVGRTDITPRPGLPMAGYSANGNYGRGFRTRLHARVIYLKAVDSKPVALVQCDLLAGSEPVRRRVAELIADKTDLDLGGIMMAATHTHSAPGGLFGSDFYVKHASNAGGMDPEFFEFASHRIADAAVHAYTHRRPAKIATGTAEVYGFTRNRSIGAYRANGNAAVEKMQDIHKAVNPEMHMVRIDCLDDEKHGYLPVAAFTSFSIHGTGVPARNDLYNADVFAYIERELEWEMLRRYGRKGFIHAVVNGTHADNSPDNAPGRQGYKEARRLGVGLGAKAIELFDSLAGDLRTDVAVRSAIREIDYYRHDTINNIGLCDTPRIGTTLLAGVTDGGPTPILRWLPVFKEGSHRRILTSGCHGNRRIFASPFQSLILAQDKFPHLITYQAIQVGKVVFLPLPYEVTMESGHRIAEASRKSAIESGMADVRFVVVSVSNGYTGYCTTKEEYGVQRYEGGHTLYGPNTNAFVAGQAARLVSDLVRKGEVRDIEDERVFHLTMTNFYRNYRSPHGERHSVTQPERSAVGDEEESWSFQWADVPPSLIDLDRRLVSIEFSEDGGEWLPLEQRGIPADDDGYDLSVRFTGSLTEGGLAIYETRWYNPEKEEKRQYRFRIEPRRGTEVLFSKSFR